MKNSFLGGIITSNPYRMKAEMEKKGAPILNKATETLGLKPSES
jgi:hypothetical protein